MNMMLLITCGFVFCCAALFWIAKVVVSFLQSVFERQRWLEFVLIGSGVLTEAFLLHLLVQHFKRAIGF